MISKMAEVVGGDLFKGRYRLLRLQLDYQSGYFLLEAKVREAENISGDISSLDVFHVYQDDTVFAKED